MKLKLSIILFAVTVLAAWSIKNDVYAGGATFANRQAVATKAAGFPSQFVAALERYCDQATLDAIETDAELFPAPLPDEKLRKLEAAKAATLAAGVLKSDVAVTELDKKIIAAEAEVEAVKEAAEAEVPLTPNVEE